MRSLVLSLIGLLLLFNTMDVTAQDVPLGQEELVKNLNVELSGESAKRNLEYITRLHRMRGSEEYYEAIEFIKGKLQRYGLEDIELIKIPTDGKTFYGTQLSRQAWNVDFAELWELSEEGQPMEKVADWESIPLSLAQDSRTGEVTAELVDIGRGDTDASYDGLDVKGKLVLTSLQPLAVAPLAVDKYGAAGIISYAQNQVTAWWKEDENLVRWGHLDSYTETETFAFMISLKQARQYQKRLYNGEKIMMHAKVEAELADGYYDILTAVIPGTDPNLASEEIMYTCHLDHPRPGANDNASGSVTILEIARSMSKLIQEGKISAPKRTIRFVWSPEIEGTTALLNYRPDLAQKTKYNVHLDMVGGGPETKSIFHVSKSPNSVPTYINAVAEAFGEFVIESSDIYASGEGADYPIVSKEGGKEALLAVMGTFDMGSDFQVFTESSWGIPAIYLHDWPDRYIHTTGDLPANIDPTKLKRSAFIGFASGYYIANQDATNATALTALMKGELLKNAQEMLRFSSLYDKEEADNIKYYFWEYEMDKYETINGLESFDKVDYKEYIKTLQGLFGAGQPKKHNNSSANMIYTRNADIKGPMGVFGYNYFTGHYDKSKPRPEIFAFAGKKGDGRTCAYEILNFVNGKNTVADIRNRVSAEFGPVPIEYVAEYLSALQSINVIR